MKKIFRKFVQGLGVACHSQDMTEKRGTVLPKVIHKLARPDCEARIMAAGIDTGLP